MSGLFYVHRQTPVTYRQFAGQVERRALTLATCAGEKVGLWADHDPDFLINLFALWRVDAVPLLLSRRLPWSTVSRLLEVSGARALITPDTAVCEGTSAKLISAGSGPVLEAHESSECPIGAPHQDVAFIVHTSGTTGLPKLVQVTRANLQSSLDFLAARWAGVWTSQDASLGFLPLFHSYGLISELLCAYRARSRYYFASNQPHEQLRFMREEGAGITLLFTVPWLLRQLLELPEALTTLRSLRYVIVGGALVGHDLGERLKATDVRLVQNYGTTEIGPTFLGPLDSRDWRDMYPVVPERYFHLDPTGQLVVHADCPSLSCHDGPEGTFETRDKFVRSEDGGYRYQSRLDDVLVHENGEKTNALAVEAALLDHVCPGVAQLVVLGQGRLRVACAIQWTSGPSTEQRAALERSLPRINAHLPSYSQLEGDLLLHLGPEALDRRLPLTAKGTVVRAKAEAELEQELDRLYASWGQRSGTSLLAFFPRPDEVERDVSLFDQGMDSIKAVAFRNHIARLYPGREIPVNLVYQYPTLERLERYLRGEAANARTPATFAPLTASELSALRCEHTTPREVLLTGSTGFVGRHLLQTLVDDESVQKVYCLVRRIPPDYALDPSDKVKYFDNYRLDDPQLGLSPADYTALSARVDSVIHAAWPVSFNATYEQLADDALASVRHLLEFARPGDKSFHLLSTVGTVMLHPDPCVGEELPATTAAGAFPHGYSQTKWEAEQLVLRSGVRHKIYRLGQFSAHSQTGSWKRDDYVPVLMRAAVKVGSTPRLPLPIDWVPVDVGCRALVELMSAPGSNVHHIVNPRSRPADSLARGGRCVPLREWLAAVEPHLPTLPRVAALWPFLQEMSVIDRPLSSLNAERTCQHSPTLAACEPISDAYLARVFPLPLPPRHELPTGS